MRIALPDPDLTDGVVALRQWAEGDVPAIVAGCREEEIERWLDQVPQPYSERDAREYIASTRRGWREGTVSNFAIVDTETGEPAGSIGVHWLDHDVVAVMLVPAMAVMPALMLLLPIMGARRSGGGAPWLGGRPPRSISPRRHGGR